ncbi:tail protein [Escherichia coli]|nr:tail protein [Escherichia coli]
MYKELFFGSVVWVSETDFVAGGRGYRAAEVKRIKKSRRVAGTDKD